MENEEIEIFPYSGLVADEHRVPMAVVLQPQPSRAVEIHHNGGIFPDLGVLLFAGAGEEGGAGVQHGETV